MASSNGSRRHPPIDLVESYIARNLHGIITIEGAPTARIVIDAPASYLRLQVPAEEIVPDVHTFENLKFDVVSEDQQTWHQLSIHVDSNLDEVYGILCVVVDRVQLSHESFALAVESSLESMAGLLATRRGLSREAQIGLFGELLVLLAMAAMPHVSEPVSSWLGPLREEHDFGYAEYDLEVKTTQRERRHHWISSQTQLKPTPNRSLYLISIQITLAGMGEGLTLPQLVELTRQRLEGERASLEVALSSVGYRDADAPLYHSRWLLRSEPAFFEVTPTFPAVTTDRIEQSVPSPERIIDLRYLIDLTGMAPSSPLFDFRDLVEWKDAEW